MEEFDQGIYAFSAGKGFFDNPYMDVVGKETEMRRWVDGMVAAIIAYREIADGKAHRLNCDERI